MKNHENKFIFERCEYKYKLSLSQYAEFLKELIKHLTLDEFKETTIQSLYYDTDTWFLIRNSIEKPIYKEKLRARSYGLASAEDKIFLELKKKYNKIVYKRRISLKEKDLHSFFNSNENENESQIEKEIKYFNKFCGGVKPKMLILYDRMAYVDKDSDLRITFDKNVRYRTEMLNLSSSLEGELLFSDGTIIMEIKTGNPYPIWLNNVLNKNKIYKTSFSKYGTAYQIYMKKCSEQMYTTKEEKIV